MNKHLFQTGGKGYTEISLFFLGGDLADHRDPKKIQQKHRVLMAQNPANLTSWGNGSWTPHLFTTGFYTPSNRTGVFFLFGIFWISWFTNQLWKRVTFGKQGSLEFFRSWISVGVHHKNLNVTMVKIGNPKDWLRLTGISGIVPWWCFRVSTLFF